MKITLSILLFCAMAFPISALAEAGGCATKRQSVEQEIAYAQAHNNERRVQGLQTALTKLKVNCTEASLRSASQRKVADAQKKLSERERAMQKAKDEGRSAKKIADHLRKMDKAHADLERAQIEADS